MKTTTVLAKPAEPAEAAPLPPVPYQGTFNAIGIFMIFWSFQRLIGTLLKNSEYRTVLETQSNLIRNQTEILTKLSETVSKLNDAVNKLL